MERRAPADASKALQIHVSRLRRALAPEDVVQTRPGGYIVDADEASLDLPRFEQLVDRGGAGWRRRTRPPRGRRSWRRWRCGEGTPLAEFAAEPFARAEIARLDELHAGVLEARVEADLALGAHASLVPELEGLVGGIPCASGCASS